MRFLKRLALALLLLAALALLVSFFLPQQVFVARATLVETSADRIFPYVNNLKKFNEWSPWAAIDPNTQFVFSGPDQGVGAKMRWTSENPNVGSGSLEIVESVRDKLVRTGLDFGDQGEATASFKLEPKRDGTQVVWSFESDLGNNPIMRWMGLLFDRWIGAEYEKGLLRLKAVAERS